MKTWGLKTEFLYKSGIQATGFLWAILQTVPGVSLLLCGVHSNWMGRALHIDYICPIGLALMVVRMDGAFLFLLSFDGG